jgi:stearoyl-CoA desaturase (delta-9 desaturase)
MLHAHDGTNRRTFPTRARRTLLAWLAHRVNALLTIVLHAGALWTLLAVPPRLFDVGISVAFYVGGMFVITAGYHRYFAHRSYRTSRAFQAVLAALGCLCTQKGALWWAATHRKHHRFADSPGDPHSPHQEGFWQSHLLWTLSSESDSHDPDAVRDLQKYPELRFLDRFCTVPLVAYVVFTAAVGGVRGVGWWYCVPTVALMHAVMLVNSASHLWGHRRFETNDHSRNNGWLAVITLGEGWHNNHHRYMNSARQGFYPWQLDVTYGVLCVLRKLGIIWDLREPPAEVLEEGRAHDRGKGPSTPACTPIA